MSVALACIRRDFLIWSSYRLAAFWQVAGAFTMMGLIYFGGTAINDRSDLIKEQHGSYVAFILLGLAFMDVLMQGLAALPRAINDNQRAGTLEPILLAPVGEWQLVGSLWLFRFFFSMFRMLLFVLFGALVLGFWHSADPLAILAVLIPAELTFVAMGAISAAFMLLVKQGDPVLIAYAAVTAVMGGAVFPVAALPGWVQPIAWLVPLTHALSGIREAFDGASVIDVAPQILVLTAMAAVLLPPALFAFKWSLNRAKQEGSLGEY